jgi:hypothetical protein
MKILITLLLALFLSSNAYAVSTKDVLYYGTVITSAVEYNDYLKFLVKHKSIVYRCQTLLYSAKPETYCRELDY